MLKRALFFILLIPQIAQPNVVSDFFSPESDPCGIRAVSVIVTVGGAGAYLVSLYLNSPRRIRNKYKLALAFYKSNKNDPLKTQYEKFRQCFTLSHAEIKRDANRLHGQQADGVQELRAALVELQYFVYHVETYVLESELKAGMRRLEEIYGVHIEASTSDLKKLILGSTSARYPFIKFECLLDAELSHINKKYASSNARKDSDKALLNDAKNFIQQLMNVCVSVRALPEFRSEQREQKLERQREKQAQEKERLERERLKIEQEKLKIEREKLFVELHKPQNPAVVINNNNGSQPSSSPATNPYLDAGSYDADGYYQP